MLLGAIQYGEALPRQGDPGAGGQPPCLGKRVWDTGASWRLWNSNTVTIIKLMVVERSVQGSPGQAAPSGGDAPEEHFPLKGRPGQETGPGEKAGFMGAKPTGACEVWQAPSQQEEGPGQPLHSAFSPLFNLLPWGESWSSRRPQ